MSTQREQCNLMPDFSSIKTIPSVFFLAASCWLTGCDSNPGPGPEIHDSKYIGVSATGEELTGGETGPCVLDRFTGLIWEVKTDTPGLRFKGHTYTWFDPDEDHAGELDYRGQPNAGNCFGSECDTHAFVQAVNQQGLCGFNDWRIPTRDELGSISDPRKTSTPPTINTQYFPNTESGEYWSSNDYQFQWNTAWVWGFGNGLDRVEWKHSPRFVRLVRGEAIYLEKVKD